MSIERESRNKSRSLFMPTDFTKSIFVRLNQRRWRLRSPWSSFADVFASGREGERRCCHFSSRPVIRGIICFDDVLSPTYR